MSRKIVLLAALGYFVDILDLFLFSVLRIPSLQGIGIPESRLMSAGVLLFNVQMAGLLAGSFFWGILGDKKGRLSVLYGSILLYSLATTANAFVASLEQYAALRFVAGFGLAGERGAAITLVSETLSRSGRGMGTTLVAGVGLMGGAAASLLAQTLHWKDCYLVGGAMGFCLLFLRLRLTEPAMYLKLGNLDHRGSLALLFSSKRRVILLGLLVLAGTPIYFVAGLLMLFSPELAKELGIQGGPVIAAKSIFYSYIGVALGDFASGFLSQRLEQRKRVVLLFLVLVSMTCAGYLLLRGISADAFYFNCALIGFATGYWAVLITMAAESFGTNLRATVTTLTPNLVRACVIPMTLLYLQLNKDFSLLTSTSIVGVGCLALSFLAVTRLPETYGKDLDFIEQWDTTQA